MRSNSQTLPSVSNEDRTLKRPARNRRAKSRANSVNAIPQNQAKVKQAIEANNDLDFANDSNGKSAKQADKIVEPSDELNSSIETGKTI